MTVPASSTANETGIAVVGVGLLGGSIAAAVRKRAAARIVGVGRNRQRLESAQSAGLIDEAMTDINDAAARCSLIVVCTPVDRIAEDVTRAAAACQTGTLITDVGSVKQTICSTLSRYNDERATFIGSHPLAGSEKAGFEHAHADLFDQDRQASGATLQLGAVERLPSIERLPIDHKGEDQLGLDDL